MVLGKVYDAVLSWPRVMVSKATIKLFDVNGNDKIQE